MKNDTTTATHSDNSLTLKGEKKATDKPFKDYRAQHLYAQLHDAMKRGRETRVTKIRNKIKEHFRSIETYGYREHLRIQRQKQRQRKQAEKKMSEARYARQIDMETLASSRQN